MDLNLIPLFLASGFSDIHEETHCILLQRFLFDDVHVDSRSIDKCDQCPFLKLKMLRQTAAMQIHPGKACFR